MYAKALQMQKKAISKKQKEGLAINEEELKLSNLEFEIAKYMAYYEQNYSKAQNFIEKSLGQDESSEKKLMLLAQICMKRGDRNVCQQKCMQIIKINPNNVEASLLLSECLLATTENQ